MTKKIVLASASPRRKELLSSMGLEFTVIPSQVEEDIENQEFSRELVEQLASEKAMDVARSLEFPAIVIGSDTVVVVGKKILGKPKDANDAAAMLSMLSDKVHQVVSGIAVVDLQNGKILKSSVVSDVKFKKLSREEINAYIVTGEPFDKAGAYAIQGRAGVFVEKINGCYSNIVGISVFELASLLENFGVKCL